MIRLIVTGLMAFLLCSQPSVAQSVGNSVLVQTTAGNFSIELSQNSAPENIGRFKMLVQSRFYNGTPFHRVVGGFVAQTGDPSQNGRGGSDLPNVRAENPSSPFQRGTVAMTRRLDLPGSANSQFFIMLKDAPHLNGKFTIIGRVSGADMSVLDSLQQGVRESNYIVNAPDRIVEMSIRSR